MEEGSEKWGRNRDVKMRFGDTCNCKESWGGTERKVNTVSLGKTEATSYTGGLFQKR